MATAESPSAVNRVVLHLRATGDAPILKQAKFKILGTNKFAKVIEFLRRQLHKETLFVYVNSAFSPNPNELWLTMLAPWHGADTQFQDGTDVNIFGANTKDFILHKKWEYEFSLTETPEQVEMEVR